MTQTSITELEKYNASRFVYANGLQKIADELTAAKTILPWVLTSGGAPGFATAMLVPIRESGSMLPQAALTPWIMSHRDSKKIWIVGALIQAASAALMSVCALALEGLWLGLGIIFFLATLAFGRSLSSITSKDIQGRIISKGHRGMISGRAATLGGAVSLTVGLGLMIFGDHAPTWVLAALIAVAAVCWVGAAAVFNTIKEPPYDHKAATTKVKNWLVDCLELFFKYKAFRRFVIIRTLMLVTALSTTFIVILAQNHDVGLGGVGTFVLSAGFASLLGGKLAGKLSDISSRNVLTGASGFASVVLVALVACDSLAPVSALKWILPLGFFLVSLAHACVRVARQTYVVDMAEGDDRTRIVGAANTLMGFTLLFVGAISGAIASYGPQAALLFLAALGFVGCAFSRLLIDVNKNQLTLS